MFHKQVVQSGEYLVLSHAAQSLYVQLCLCADDDGFIKDAIVAKRLTGTTDTELQELIDGGFIFRFDSGVIVVLHWKINNEIKPDRYHQTKFGKEKMLTRIDENRMIVILEPEWNQNGTGTDTEIDSPVSPVKISEAKRSTTQEGEHREETRYSGMEEAYRIAREKGVLLDSYTVNRMRSVVEDHNVEYLIQALKENQEFVNGLKKRVSNG